MTSKKTSTVRPKRTSNSWSLGALLKKSSKTTVDYDALLAKRLKNGDAGERNSTRACPHGYLISLDCTVCSRIGMDRSQKDRWNLKLGHVRTEQDYNFTRDK